MVVERTMVVRNKTGLHARPAALFVQAASRFKSTIRVVKDGREADAKSLISVLALGVNMGSTVTVRATGEDATDAVGALVALVESGFGDRKSVV